MKILTLTSALLFIAFQSATAVLMPEKSASAFEHLSEVNKQWLKLAHEAPATTVSFQDDADRISYHLMLVETILRKHTPASLSKTAKNNRLRLLDELKRYAAEKTFPKNIGHLTRTPYFIDHLGTHCAVGQLIAASGHEALAQRIKTEHNFDYIRDIRTPGLSAWAQEHGFTADELAWIQPAYAPGTKFFPVGQGTDGPVTLMANDPYNNRLIIAGNFTTLDDFPCENIGLYDGVQLSCLGSGISGNISSLYAGTNSIVVAGAFNNNGSTWPLASYADNQWTYTAIPGITDATATAVCALGLIHVAISDPAVPGVQTIWSGNEATPWKKLATVNGTVNQIAFSNAGMVYAGDFNSLTAHNSSGDVVYSASNLALNEWGTENWMVYEGDNSPENILSVQPVGDFLYVGGYCSTDGDKSDVCLARFTNGVMQPLLLTVSLSAGNEAQINTMIHQEDNLYFGGDFLVAQVVGFMGTNLAGYDLVYGYPFAFGNLDQPVHGLTYFGNKMFLGGEFTSYGPLPEQQLPHLASADIAVAIEDPAEAVVLETYPNPAAGYFTLKAGEHTRARITVSDAAGRVVVDQQAALPFTMETESWSPGIYVVQVESADGFSARTRVAVQ